MLQRLAEPDQFIKLNLFSNIQKSYTKKHKNDSIRYYSMIDRNLNYGRHLINNFTQGVGPSNNILDLGAGKGADLDIAAKNHPHAKLHAIEFYEPNIQILKEKGINVLQRNIECDSLPFNNESIDIVLANQVLEHTKELFWIVHEITRVLPVGGNLIIGVPNLASLHNRLLLLLGKQPSPIKNYSAHVRGFTKGDLLSFFENCFPGGYKLIGYGGSNFYPFPASIATPLANMLPSMAWGLFIRLEKQKPYNQSFLEYPIHENLETNFYLGPSG